ncbi:hypothetical protein CMK13_02145 [Candidatus Poribacteria bacterium]|nr:hypothetical protein [Candidatus Poribacteria bacterium]
MRKCPPKPINRSDSNGMMEVKKHYTNLLTSAEIQNQIQDFDFEANMVSTKAVLEQMIQSEPVLGWFHEILDNGGHDELVHGQKVIKE